MKVSAIESLQVPRCGFLLALLVLGGSLPCAARASCLNSHVSSNSKTFAGSAHLELLALTGALKGPREEIPNQRPLPCTGAMCSGNPAPPLSPVPSVPPSSGEQWAVASAAPDVNEPSLLAYQAFEVALRPVEGLCSVFHPPRFLASALIASTI
jgi:hypothetical protein